MQDKLAELRALVYCEPPDELFTDEKCARLCELFADVTALDTRAMLAEYLFGHEVTMSGMRGVFVPSRISAGGVGVSLLLWRRVATGFEVARRDIAVRAGKPEPTTWSARALAYEEPETTGMTGTGRHLWAGFHLDLQGGGLRHFGQRTPIEAHITTEFTSPVPDHRHIVVEYGDPFPPDLDVLVDTASDDGSAELDGGHILRVRVPWHEPGPVSVALYTVEVDRGVMPEGSLGTARRELVEQVRELVSEGADFEEAQRRINELNEELHRIIYSRTRPGACPVCGEHALVELDDIDDGAACLACEIQRARETR